MQVLLPVATQGVIRACLSCLLVAVCFVEQYQPTRFDWRRSYGA